MFYQRHISRIHNVPQLAPGFVGPGHLAAPVISPEDFALNDPFILLMDDHFDIGDRPVGGPHPHAGFETVTLLLQGSVYDRDEGGFIEAGEVQWMTAGRGIIHGENVGAKGKVRLLQLWLTLPKADRWNDGLLAFAPVRPRLFGIAYRMLGSAAEAEDVVQDVWLRWQSTNRSVVQDPPAYLATTTTRLCINLAQSAHKRRETYIGVGFPNQWTPVAIRQ